MKKSIFILICLIILLSSIVGCTNKNTSGITNISTEDSVQDVFLTDVGYCEIAYPTKWQSNIIIDRESEDNVVKFLGRLGDNEVPLFDISFNDAENEKIGDIITDSGNIAVSIKMYEYDKTKYTDQYYDQYCAMCDDINVIIAKLHEMYNFTDKTN